MKEKEGLFKQDQFLKSIAENERIKRGMSQEKLGELVGKKQTAIQPYLTGTRIPKDLSLYREIYKVFGFTEQQINDIFLKAKTEGLKGEFGEEKIGTILLDNIEGEIVTTREEAETVLFKLNGLEPTEEDIDNIRAVLDFAKNKRKILNFKK